MLVGSARHGEAVAQIPLPFFSLLFFCWGCQWWIMLADRHSLGDLFLVNGTYSISLALSRVLLYLGVPHLV